MSADWHGVPMDKIEERKILSVRYLVAFVSREFGYVRIIAAAP